MPDIKLVGAVAIKVRPNAKGFRGQTQRQVSEELAGYDVKVQVKVKGDTTELKTDVERAKKAAEAKELTLKVGLDYDSVRRAQQQLDRAIKGMAAEEITVKLDDEGIAKAQARLAEMMDNAEVDMTFVADEKGFREVLAKIEEIRRQKLEEEITFGIDEASLNEAERKIRNRMNNGMTDAKLSIKYNNNRASIEKAIAEVNAELDRIKAVNLDVSVDKKSLKTARRALQAALTDTPVELKVNYDDQESLRATRERLKEMLNELHSKTLSVDVNEAALRKELQHIDSMIKEEVDKNHKVDIKANATGLELVARQLQFASRARRVPFFVVLDKKSVAVAEGLLRSLAGINTLQAAGRGLESIITEFDTILLKSAAWGSAIMSIADTLFYVSSAALTIGGGMAQVIGLLAAAPLAFTALASVMVIGISVFKDFGAAAHGIDAALKRLPESGQKAALMIRDVFKNMRESISEQFWSKASDSMLRFVETALPSFTRGLADTSSALGGIFGRILDSFTNMGAAGDLDVMFKNLVKGFDNSAAGATAFWNAINTLGLKGSELFPRFGSWLTDMSVRFENWINTAAKNGDITSWIEGGINSLKDMWRTTGAIIDQFKGLTRAANLIGPNGLDDFRRNMEHVADVMNAEPFKSKMGTIFFGAREGAHELNAGVKDLVGSFSDAASWTATLMTLFGRFGGEVLTGLSRTIGNLNFQKGITEALRGMSDMIRTMTPAFDHLGGLIGNVGTISSSVFRGLGPVFNTLLGILDDSISKIAGNLTKIAPSLLTLTNNLLGFARGPITLLVDGLNLFLEVLNGLPTPLRDAALAFGTFLLLRNQFGAFAGALSGMWTKLTTSSVTGTKDIEAATAALSNGSINNVPTTFRKMADGSIREVNRFGAFLQTGMANARTTIANFEPNSIVGKLSTAASGVASVVGRINSALALIGGIPGIALGVIGIALSAIGSNAAEASANIDKLRESLNKSDGSATADTLTTISAKITEIDKAGDAWANFWRGVVNNSEAGNEALKKLGMNIGDVSRIIVGSRNEYDAFVTSLKTLGNAGNLKELADFLRSGTVANDVSKRPMAPGDEFATNIAKLKSLKDQADAVKNLGLSADMFDGPNAISTQSIQNLTSKMDEQRLAFELAQRGQAIYAQTLGTTAEKAKEVASIVQIIGDVSQAAAGKIDAINRSLELLNNNKVSEQEAKIARVEGIEAAVENAKAIAESIQASRSAIFDQNGLISEQSKAGRDLFKIMKESADSVKIQAQAAYDAAIKNGDTALVASRKAVAVVKTGEGDLQRIADAAGITVDDLRAQWGAFFGSDWDLIATFSANTDNFLAGEAEARRLGIEFNKEKFTAWLMANPDPAKVTTDQVKAYMEDYARTNFKATLDALPAPAQAAIADVLGRADAFARGDYQAVLDAFNAASPVVQGAINFIRANYTNPAWMATISAAANQGSFAAVELALIRLSRPREAVVNVTYSDVGRDLAMASRAPASRFGSILDRFGRGMNGFNPEMVKFFANGGIEQHIAQISRGPVRIWSEPETGGEAYIPLAVSKRPRSVEILAEVAKKFGFELTRAQKYADGSAGGHAVPTRTSSTSVTVGTINTVDPETAVKKLQQMQRDALAVAGIES